MIYDRQEECMRVTLQMHFTHAHLEPLKAAHSTYVSMYCYGRALGTYVHKYVLLYGRALGNNPGPVTGSGALTDVPMPLSYANKRWHFSLGCESKGKLKGDHHKQSGLLLAKAYGGCPWMRKLTDADSRHQKALKSHLATYITARCRLQPRWLPVVALLRNPGDVVEMMVNGGKVCTMGLMVSEVSSTNTLLNY